MPREHICKDNEWSAEPSWWVNDGRGIPLAERPPHPRARTHGLRRGAHPFG